MFNIPSILGFTQFSSQSLSRVRLCVTPMDYSTPGLPVHHQLPEFTQTRAHWVGDATQPSHPLGFIQSMKGFCLFVCFCNKNWVFDQMARAGSPEVWVQRPRRPGSHDSGTFGPAVGEKRAIAQGSGSEGGASRAVGRGLGRSLCWRGRGLGGGGAWGGVWVEQLSQRWVQGEESLGLSLSNEQRGGRRRGLRNSRTSEAGWKIGKMTLKDRRMGLWLGPCRWGG